LVFEANMSCQIRCDQNVKGTRESEPSRVSYQNSQKATEDDKPKIQARCAADENNDNEYDEDDVPELMAAIILSLRLDDTVKKKPSESKQNELQEQNKNGPIEEDLWAKTADNEFDYRPLLRKALFLTRGVEKQTSRVKELLKPSSSLYDKPDEKEKLEKKNTEPPEASILNPLLWSLQETYDKNTLSKVLSLICKILSKILENPNPVTSTDRRCGNIRTIKRGSTGWLKVLAVEKSEEILICAGFCIDPENNYLELKKDAINPVCLKNIINLLTVTMAECTNDARKDVFSRGVTLEVLQSVLELYKNCKNFPPEASNNDRVLLSGELLVQRVILPATKKWKCSYAELLKTNVGAVNVFISHAWSYKFDELVNAVENFEKQKCDGVKRYYFLDYLAVNQNKDCGKSLALNDLKNLEPLIKKVKEFVLVTSPWNSPIPLTRAWCILEIATAQACDVEFFISMPSSQHKKFVEAIMDGGNLWEVFWKLDTERAKATVPEDETMIKEKVLRELGGFDRLNASLASYLRTWFERKVVAIDEDWPANENQSIRQYLFLRSTADLFYKQGKWEKALFYTRRNLKICEIVYGSNHIRTLVVKRSLGYLVREIFGLQESLVVHREVLVNAYDCEYTNPIVLEWMGTLANTIIELNMFRQSIELSRGLIKAMLAMPKPDIDLLLRMRNSLSKALQENGNFNEAYNEQRYLLQISIEVYGKSHRNTLWVRLNFGTTNSLMGKDKEALQLYSEVLKQSTKVYGKQNRLTLHAKMCIGNTLAKLQRFDEAIKILSEVVDIAKEALGPDHMVTVQSNILLSQCLCTKKSD